MPLVSFRFSCSSQRGLVLAGPTNGTAPNTPPLTLWRLPSMPPNLEICRPSMVISLTARRPPARSHTHGPASVTLAWFSPAGGGGSCLSLYLSALASAAAAAQARAPATSRDSRHCNCIFTSSLLHAKNAQPDKQEYWIPRPCSPSLSLCCCDVGPGPSLLLRHHPWYLAVHGVLAWGRGTTCYGLDGCLESWPSLSNDSSARLFSWHRRLLGQIQSLINRCSPHGLPTSTSGSAYPSRRTNVCSSCPDARPTPEPLTVTELLA